MITEIVDNMIDKIFDKTQLMKMVDNLPIDDSYMMCQFVDKVLTILGEKAAKRLLYEISNAIEVAETPIKFENLMIGEIYLEFKFTEYGGCYFRLLQIKNIANSAPPIYDDDSGDIELQTHVQYLLNNFLKKDNFKEFVDMGTTTDIIYDSFITLYYHVIKIHDPPYLGKRTIPDLNMPSIAIDPIWYQMIDDIIESISNTEIIIRILPNIDLGNPEEIHEVAAKMVHKLGKKIAKMLIEKIGKLMKVGTVPVPTVPSAPERNIFSKVGTEPIPFDDLKIGGLYLRFFFNDNRSEFILFRVTNIVDEETDKRLFYIILNNALLKDNFKEFTTINRAYGDLVKRGCRYRTFYPVYQ